MWTIGASVGSRLIGVVGTLLITHFLAPDVVGEVGVATVLVMSMNRFSHVGFGSYVIATQAGREASFHITVYTLTFALAAFGILILIAEPIAPWFDAPTMAQYVPGLVGAVFIQRIGFVASRILARDMRFRVIAIGLAVGEIAYTVVSVGLAATGWGGESIVIGNLARALSHAIIYCAAADRREWLEPYRLTWERTREIFRFGAPLWIGQMAQFASQRWDNLLFSGIFGPYTLGLYNLAYNLADIPSTQVGEHIGDVLLPSYSRMGEKQRRYALVQSTALMSLIVFPLAIGLCAIAPTLVAILFNEEWQGVASFLVILSSLSVVRPVGWTIQSYLTARHLTRAVMYLELLKVAVLLGAVAGLGTIGPLWAASGVGVAFGVSSVAAIWSVQRLDRIPMRRIVRGMVGPLVACVPMAAAVVGTRHGVAHLGFGETPLSLVAELASGGVVYIGSAFIFAAGTSREFLRLVRSALGRGGTDSDDDDDDDGSAAD